MVGILNISLEKKKVDLVDQKGDEGRAEGIARPHGLGVSQGGETGKGGVKIK